jgi:hypothetical protein
VIALAGAFALVASGRIAERTETVSAPPNDAETTVEARCPKGKRVALGGLAVPPGTDFLTPTELVREGKRKWSAGVRNFGSDDARLTSIAYCGKLKGIKARTETVQIPPLGEGDAPVAAEAKCKRGERLAFGGFDYEVSADNQAYVSQLSRAGKRGWVAAAFNFDDTAPLTAIAYCSKQAAKTTTHHKTVSVGGDEPGKATARCGRGEQLAFGGYRAEVHFIGAFVLLRGLARASARSWKVDAFNGNEVSAGDLTAFAYCAKK